MRLDAVAGLAQRLGVRLDVFTTFRQRHDVISGHSVEREHAAALAAARLPKEQAFSGLL
jgi:hypothetical protein